MKKMSMNFVNTIDASETSYKASNEVVNFKIEEEYPALPTQLLSTLLNFR